MIIKFNIKFSTKPGQELFLKADFLKEEGGSIKMAYETAETWAVVYEIDEQKTQNLRYKYVLLDKDGVQIEEGGYKNILLEGIKGNLELLDTWNDQSNIENVFYTDPFQEILLYRKKKKAKKHRGPFTHIFKIKAPLLKENESVCLLGSGAELHQWDTGNPIRLQEDEEGWFVKVSLHPGEVVNYKYGIVNSNEGYFLRFEEGENRSLSVPAEITNTTILHDGFLRIPKQPFKGAGMAIPVFSLKTKHSFGIGEFTDLKPLADWAKKTGLKMIQILPVNDTTATGTRKDSYPYASISAFALHPVYLNLETLAGKKYEELLKPLKKKQKQLNELPSVDYENVLKFKISVAKELFQLQKDEFQKEKNYKTFFENNRHWLEAYAAFCVLRDKYGTADFNSWKTHRTYSKLIVSKFVSPSSSAYEEVKFVYFLQYHLHLQLKKAAEYLHKNGIILKGDIPIGIYRYGADAWMHHDLFHINQQAGAPPDSFALKGQNWGFPTYNWEKMAEDGFKWWEKRFQQMSEYFDAFRIDHILGFFRIWSIPEDAVEGIMGRFVPAIPVHIREFAERGMWFNFHRLCTPFINDAVLWDMFGPNKEKFLEYLKPSAEGNYELKEAFNTQLKIKKHFEGREEEAEAMHLQQGLFNLVSNFLLSEEEGSAGTKFHFRFNIQETASFRHLDEHMKHALLDLYNNYYFQRQDEFWRKTAYHKLPALKNSTNMLVCGEDLGLVPHIVPKVMRELGILSLEVQRMPKELGKSFFRPADAGYLSVVTPSTHDMSTIRGWWKEENNHLQQFYNEELGKEGEAPLECSGDIVRKIIRQHLHSPAMWSIFQLQDLLGADETIRRENPDEERINDPSDPNNYWNYRMHIAIENLLKEKEFNAGLKSDIEEAGR